MKKTNSNRILRPVKTKAAFDNVVRSAGRRKVRVKKIIEVPKRVMAVRHPIGKITHARKLISPAEVNALHTAISSYFPNNYPGARIPMNDVLAPTAVTTLRQRMNFSTLTDGAGAFQAFLTFSPRPVPACTFGSTFAAGAVSAVTSVPYVNNAGMVANYATLVPVSMEVVIRNTNASSSIAGNFVVVNIPQPATYIGNSYANIAGYANAYAGNFTDGAPSVRGLWQRLDESDSVLLPPGSGAVSNETILVFAISSSVSQPLQADIIINYQGVTTLAGSNILPSTTKMVDDGAYARATEALTKIINGNQSDVIDPRRADSAHSGYLRQMANYVAGSVADGAALAKAVLGAVQLYNGVASGFGVSTSNVNPTLDTLFRLLALLYTDKSLIKDVQNPKLIELLTPFTKFNSLDLEMSTHGNRLDSRHVSRRRKQSPQPSVVVQSSNDDDGVEVKHFQGDNGLTALREEVEDLMKLATENKRADIVKDLQSFDVHALARNSDDSYNFLHNSQFRYEGQIPLYLTLQKRIITSGKYVKQGA